MATSQWMDAVPRVSYEAEKDALRQMVAWGGAAGWEPADLRGLEFDSRQQADLVLRSGPHLLRVAVQQKRRSTDGLIRIQAVPTFREAFLRKGRSWSLEFGAVPIDREWDRDTFLWLIGRLFAE